MKKLILLFALITALLSGCKKDDENQHTGLSGTKWVSGSYYITFSSGDKVLFGMKDSDVDIKSAGTYTVAGNDVVFSNIAILYNGLMTYTISGGVINQNKMTVSMSVQFTGMPKTHTTLNLEKQ